MEIKRQTEGNTVHLLLTGRLDTVTSNRLANELGEVFAAGPVSLVLDFSNLEYISSAGLRVLLTAQKKVKALGTEMHITGANDDVREVFDITGFSTILTIV